MIKCNLAVLLAERNLRISDLSKRTGISRTTLTALTHNQGKGIQFDTFDSICSVLKVSPGDLFIHEPLEYQFDIIEIPEDFDLNTYRLELDISAQIIYKQDKINQSIRCTITLEATAHEDELDLILVNINYPESIETLFGHIPVSFKTSIEEEILDCIKAEMIARYNIENNVKIHSIDFKL